MEAKDWRLEEFWSAAEASVDGIVYAIITERKMRLSRLFVVVILCLWVRLTRCVVLLAIRCMESTKPQ